MTTAKPTSWQERALELYSTTNLSKKEITNVIEKEFGLHGMYNAVRGQIRRHGGPRSLETSFETSDLSIADNRESDSPGAIPFGIDMVRFLVLDNDSFFC